MECPYCGAELIYDDYYGTGRQEYFYGTAGNGIYYPSTFKKLGDIYYCPNREGFEDSDMAKSYQNNHDELKDMPIEDICCDIGCFNGHFYTDNNGNLHEGYPC
jgi:hypothetical protein